MSRRLSLKIGVSGVRGIVGESLTPQLVTSFSAAFGTYAGAGPILVGTDTRPSRVMVKHALMAGLLSVGCEPIDAGILPIPALQHHVPKVGAFGGICITASHNPIEWNALKFFGPDGILLRPNQALELTNLYHQGLYPRVGSDQMADVRSDETAILRHRESVLAAVDVDAVRRRRFRVAVDCCNGAASHATPAFLEALGCEVIPLYTDPFSTFPHPPEPLPENLVELCALIREHGADIGFAQDADADRLAVIDEKGVPLGEDSTVTLAVRHFLKRNLGPVVVNISTSRMVDDVAAAFGVPVHRTSVGEINVVQAMLERNSPVGGEGNGGVICPSINPCRDSYVAMALLLEALAQEGGTIREMREQIPSYAIVKEKLLCPARGIAPALRKLEGLFRDAEFDATDGLKAVWPDRWLSARGSNTEPIIRLTAEAPTEADARSLMHSALECLSPSG